MPDRIVVLEDWENWKRTWVEDWIRWKAKWTHRNLAIVGVVIAALVIGLMSFVAAGRARDEVLEAKAETAAVEAELNSQFAVNNAQLIFELCQRFNRGVRGTRNFVGNLAAENPRRDEILAQYDHDNPEEVFVQPDALLPPTTTAEVIP